MSRFHTWSKKGLHNKTTLRKVYVPLLFLLKSTSAQIRIHYDKVISTAASKVISTQHPAISEELKEEILTQATYLNLFY